MNFKSLISKAQVTAKRFASDITPSGIAAGATAIAVLGALFDGDIEVFTQTASDIDGTYTEVDSIQEAMDLVEDHARASADEESWYASVGIDEEIVFESFDN